MKFLPGITYVTCTLCKGEGRVGVAAAKLPGNATRAALSLLLLVICMLAIPVVGGVSPLDLLRRSILAVITLFSVSVAGGFVIPWVLHRMSTQLCSGCRGGGWVPGKIPGT